MTKESSKSKPRGAASPVHTRSLKFAAVATLAIAIASGLIGFLVAQVNGLYSALIGSALGAIFMGLTAVSVLVASSLKKRSDPDFRFVGIVMGTWILKLVAFVVIAFWLGRQSWLVPWVFFLTSVAVVLAFLVVDVIVLQSSRIPYVDVMLPGEGSDSGQEIDRKS
ncbi:MAG: hypothetical protein KF867_00410 [Cryobacterium sp.]|nr:hypothetical protein [Cryobacterium sp.]MBX3103415.1 hypothetical protein [Cryobacterium sp.]